MFGDTSPQGFENLTEEMVCPMQGGNKKPRTLQRDCPRLRSAQGQALITAGVYGKNENGCLEKPSGGGTDEMR